MRAYAHARVYIIIYKNKENIVSFDTLPRICSLCFSSLFYTIFIFNKFLFILPLQLFLTF